MIGLCGCGGQPRLEYSRGPKGLELKRLVCDGCGRSTPYATVMSSAERMWMVVCGAIAPRRCPDARSGAGTPSAGVYRHRTSASEASGDDDPFTRRKIPSCDGHQLFAAYPAETRGVHPIPSVCGVTDHPIRVTYNGHARPRHPLNRARVNDPCGA